MHAQPRSKLLFHHPRMAAFLRLGAAAAVLLATAPGAQAQFNIFGLGGPKTPPALAAKLGKPVPAALMSTLARASRAGLALATVPDAAGLIPVSGPRPNAGRKVGLLYVGAEFCPYCAGDRWGLVLALLRFGKLEGMRYMASSASDVYANTPTLTFQHATYRSAWLDLQAVETADREQHPLMQLDKRQTAIFLQFDAPPYVGIPESIPFVYVDGRYVLGELLATPDSLDGKDWRQIADALDDPHSALFKGVMPRVNLLTAAICRLDGEKPADVCRAPGVVAAQGTLAHVHAVGP